MWPETQARFISTRLSSQDYQLPADAYVAFLLTFVLPWRTAHYLGVPSLCRRCIPKIRSASHRHT
jgi:hypothetical protein